VQLGFVHTFFPPLVPDLLHQQAKMGSLDKHTFMDLGLSDSSGSSTLSPSPMAIRCWDKYFARQQPSKGHSSIAVGGLLHSDAA